MEEHLAAAQKVAGSTPALCTINQLANSLLFSKPSLLYGTALRMKDIRPYICAKLKEMREQNKPVWISYHGFRYKCVPFDPWEEGWPIFNQGWFLVKNKGRYFISYVIERQGRAYTNLYGGSTPFYMSLDNVLARVVFPDATTCYQQRYYKKYLRK